MCVGKCDMSIKYVLLLFVQMFAYRESSIKPRKFFDIDMETAHPSIQKDSMLNSFVNAIIIVIIITLENYMFEYHCSLLWKLQQNANSLSYTFHYIHVGVG